MKTPRRHSLMGISALAAALMLGIFTPGAAEETPAAQGSVMRAVFTSHIVEREPADDLATIPNSLRQVYFFSELRDLEGQIVTHRWEYNGEVMAEVKFKVGGPRWRVYSSKNLLPEWLGKWTVLVLDESGSPIRASIFEYTAQ
jgi:hypothetical protein